MKSAKKIVALVLAVVLVAAVSVGLTLAYLTDSTETVTNTFTVGNIDIKLDEAKVTRDNNTDLFVASDERVTSNEYERVYPGAHIPKDPTVTVLEGSEKAYVAAMVEVNKGSTLMNLTGSFNPAEFFDGDWDRPADMVFGRTTGWMVAGAKMEDNGTLRLLFVYTDKNMNIEVVDALDADVKLPALFTGITVPGTLTNEQLASLDDMEIDVTAYAIQSAGFTDMNEAYTAAVDAFKLGDKILSLSDFLASLN